MRANQSRLSFEKTIIASNAPRSAAVKPRSHLLDQARYSTPIGTRCSQQNLTAFPTQQAPSVDSDWMHFLFTMFNNPPKA